MLSYVGWVATVLFAGSYLFKEPRSLSIMQAVAALVWIVYGTIIASGPVIAANIAVATMACYSAWRYSTAKTPSKQVVSA